jgi:hypothetical protein
MPSSATDPGVLRLLDAIAAGTTAADSVGALVLRLVQRVSLLERTSQQHAQQLDKLAKEPQIPWALAEAPKPKAVGVDMPAPGETMTGIDATGASVRISTPRPRGRPPGRRDSHPRRKPIAVVPTWSHREDLDVG